MVVTVHEDPRLAEVHVDDAVEHVVQIGGLLLGEGDALVAAHEPHREELQLAHQQLAVVLGQHAGAAGELDGDQRAEGFGVQIVGVVLGERLQVGGAAQVGQEQETFFEILLVDVRHMHAGGPEKLGHLDVGPAIFVGGRGVHDDQRHGIVSECNPEVAPEAGVGAGRSDFKGAAGKFGGDPGLELLASFHGSR